MWLKPAIAIVFFLLVLSLGSGLFFLFKDQGATKRTLHSLGVRVILAAVLLTLITYGALTGQLKSNAPWSTQNRAPSENQTLEDVNKQK